MDRLALPGIAQQARSFGQLDGVATPRDEKTNATRLMMVLRAILAEELVRHYSEKSARRSNVGEDKIGIKYQ